MIKREFFERDTLTVAKELLGKYLVRETKENGKKKILIGKIVETEAYVGEDDLACHASKGKTPRTEIMYGEAGHAYIYLIYGMYNLLNIVTEKEGFPAAVLIRAVEPIDSSAVTGSAVVQDLKKPGSGPGKLSRWMDIDKRLNGIDMIKSDELFISSSVDGSAVAQGLQTIKISDIVTSKRIGVDYAEHCALHPWRFYIKDNPYVSKIS